MMLLKSCAMPPASRPTASIFCDCRYCSLSSPSARSFSRMTPVCRPTCRRSRTTYEKSSVTAPPSAIATDVMRRSVHHDAVETITTSAPLRISSSKPCGPPVGVVSDAAPVTRTRLPAAIDGTTPASSRRTHDVNCTSPDWTTSPYS